MADPKHWRIYPTEKTWLTCQVWETREEMQKAMFNADNPKLKKKIYDYKSSNAGFQDRANWNSRKESKVSGHLGTFYFHKNCCDIGIITHEIQHFLSHWIVRMKWGRKLTKKYSEPIAEMSENLISQFMKEYYLTFIEGKTDMPTQLHSYIRVTNG